MTADRGGSIGAATVGSLSVGGRDRCWPTPDNTQHSDDYATRNEAADVAHKPPDGAE